MKVAGASREFAKGKSLAIHKIYCEKLGIFWQIQVLMSGCGRGREGATDVGY